MRVCEYGKETVLWVEMEKITQIFFYFWRELHTHTHTRARKGIGMRVFYRKRKLISKSTAAGTIGSFMEQCERQTKRKRKRAHVIVASFTPGAVAVQLAKCC